MVNGNFHSLSFLSLFFLFVFRLLTLKLRDLMDYNILGGKVTVRTTYY